MEEARKALDPRIDLILAHIQGQDARDAVRDVKNEKILDLKLKPLIDSNLELRVTVFGDKSKGNQGLEVDVHDLKIGSKRKNFILSTIAAPVLGGVGMKIWEWVRGH